MNFLLSVAPENYGEAIINTKGFGETLLFGLEILAIGMIAVFSVLVLIWFSLILFKKAMYRDESTTKKASVDQPAEPASPAVVATANDSELIAVIAAAIAAAEQDSGNGAKFRVVSFKRK